MKVRIPSRLRLAIVSSTLCLAAAAAAQSSARLEVRPDRAVTEGFEAVRFEAVVFLEGARVPTLPEALGARVVAGNADVEPRWEFDSEVERWSWHFEVRPRATGMTEIEVYHRELTSAVARYSLLVNAGIEDAPPVLFRVESGETYRRLDPTTPVYLLPDGALHILATVTGEGLERLAFGIDSGRDFTIEHIRTGELLVVAAAQPETPGARRHLIVEDTGGRRPRLALPIIVIHPCLVCGGAHHPDLHPEYGELAEDVIEAQPLLPPEPALLEVADAIEFRTLNSSRPAPTYLETRERVAIFTGRTLPRLARLDAVIEQPDGGRRVFLDLAHSSQDSAAFQVSFRLKAGSNEITFLIIDSDGQERTATFSIFRIE